MKLTGCRRVARPNGKAGQAENKNFNHEEYTEREDNVRSQFDSEFLSALKKLAFSHRTNPTLGDFAACPAELRSEPLCLTPFPAKFYTHVSTIYYI